LVKDLKHIIFRTNSRQPIFPAGKERNTGGGGGGAKAFSVELGILLGACSNLGSLGGPLCIDRPQPSK